MEENDPHLILREELSGHLYTNHAIANGHPNVITAATQYKRSQIKVKPTLAVKFNFQQDEKAAIIAGSTNCLSHALNRDDIGNTTPVDYARALMAISQRDNAAALKTLEKSLRTSGLVRILEHAADPTRSHVMAIFLNDTDNPRLWGQFDAWRKNTNGWSGKPGKYYPRQEDFSGATFTSPETADLGLFGHLVGYYKLQDKGAIVETDLELSL
ncbi:MAG: hypothetical protein AB8B83_00365 [Bdellovibrionales bacterium]